MGMRLLATPLSESTKNAHKFLRPDGFPMMLEMTETFYWVNLISGCWRADGYCATVIGLFCGAGVMCII